MTGDQTMDHRVRTQHLYSHDGTCTRSGLHRIPLILVAFHATSFIVPVVKRCQLSWLYSSVYKMSSSIMEILIHCILYVVMTTHDICISCLFMAIVLLCIWDCYMYIYSHKTRFIIVLYWWVDGSSTWVSLLHFWDGYNLFWPSCYPCDLNIRGHLL